MDASACPQSGAARTARSGSTNAAGPAVRARPPGPPGTDIWLATMTINPDGMPTLGELANITGRPGYDNQPHFWPDGSGFWFTVVIAVTATASGVVAT